MWHPHIVLSFDIRETLFHASSSVHTHCQQASLFWFQSKSEYLKIFHQSELLQCQVQQFQESACHLRQTTHRACNIIDFWEAVAVVFRKFFLIMARTERVILNNIAFLCILAGTTPFSLFNQQASVIFSYVISATVTFSIDNRF